MTDLQKRNLEHTAAELKEIVAQAAETKRKHADAVTTHEFAQKRRTEALQEHENSERKLRVARDRFRAACDALIPDEASLTTIVHVGGILRNGCNFIT